MTAKTILSLAQAHRKEPSKANYDALADAVRKLEAERDAAVAARAYLAAPEQSEENVEAEVAYSMIDRFLRNNLDDEDYAEFSTALDAISSPALQSAIEALVRDAERYRWLRDSMDSPIVSEAQATDKMVDAAIAAQKGTK